MSEEKFHKTEFNTTGFDLNKKPNKLVEAIMNTPNPKGGGLLWRLADKDKQLSEHYDLQSEFRKGFLLAEEIVKKWAKEIYGI